MVKPRIGAHMSIAGGLEKALLRGKDLQCRTIQLFTKNATTWRERTLGGEEIRVFRRTGLETGIRPIVAHGSYLVNLATPEKELHEKSLRALYHEIQRCECLGIEDLVIHPGAHRGKGIDYGVSRIADALNRLFRETEGSSVRIALEMTAGQGTAIGDRLAHHAMIIDKVSAQSRLAFCLDTCHAFAAGYDIRTEEGWNTFLKDLDSRIGLKRLRVLHLNDSKRECGSRVDRHENIGAGMIGESLFRRIMTDRRFWSVPMIIETPKENDGINLNLLREYAKKSS